MSKNATRTSCRYTGHCKPGVKVRPFKKTRFDVSEPNGLTNFGAGPQSGGRRGQSARAFGTLPKRSTPEKRKESIVAQRGDFKTQDAGI